MLAQLAWFRARLAHSTWVAGLGAALTLGCIRPPTAGGEPRGPKAEPSTPVPRGRTAPPAVPFGAHRQAYVEGSIRPSGELAELDASTAAAYDEWRSTYLRADCGVGRYLVGFGDEPDKLTVSEAHGYGMLLLAYMAGHDPEAQVAFDGMLQYYLEHPSSSDGRLMAWRQGASCKSTSDASNATDGDVDVAYALLLADRQWGSCGGVDYLSHARRIIGALRESNFDRTFSYPLLGDWVTADGEHGTGTRSSDFITAQYRSFGAMTSEPGWSRAADNLLRMSRDLQARHAPTTGLLPDFIESAPGKARPARGGFLEAPTDGSYSWNACRVPWRLGTDYLLYGTREAREVVLPLATFLRDASGGEPARLRGGGYTLDGAPAEKDVYESLAFSAPAAVGAMVDSSLAPWLDALHAHVLAAPSDGYYGDTLRVLALVVMSGNWWAPEREPDPCR